MVVFGHLLIAVIDVGPDGRARGENLFALRPTWGSLAALAPMPVFFAAAGFANASVSLRRAAPRLRRLLGAATVVVVVWSIAVVVVSALSDTDLFEQGARLATQPLWFLAAYLPFAAAATRLSGIVARTRSLVIGTVAVLGVLATLDLLRFGAGWPSWIGWPGFFLAWGLPWMVGAWWRANHLEWSPARERAAGAALLVSGVVGAWALVRFLGYRAALIDFGETSRSNTTPPTLYTAVAGLAQAGALLAAAGALDRIAVRWRRIWSWLGTASIGIYVWHLTALALVVGLVDVGGIDLPRRLSATWWSIRPLWILSVVVVALLLVAINDVAGRRMATQAARVEPSSPRLAVGLIVGTAGAALVGLRGPQSVTLAIGCTMLFVVAWSLMRPVGQA